MAAAIDGRKCVVHLTGKAVVALDPASGQALWRHSFATADGFGDDLRRSGVAATPVVVGNRVVFSHHVKFGPTFGACVEVSGGKTKLLWKSRELADQWHGCTLWKGRLYGHSRNGRSLACLDPGTGEVKWTARRVGDARVGGVFLIADGKIILWNRGVVTLAEISDSGCKLLASAKVSTDAALQGFTVPVLCDGRLYLRTTALPDWRSAGGGELICLDLRTSQTPRRSLAMN